MAGYVIVARSRVNPWIHYVSKTGCIGSADHANVYRTLKDAKECLAYFRKDTSRSYVIEKIAEGCGRKLAFLSASEVDC